MNMIFKQDGLYRRLLIGLSLSKPKQLFFLLLVFLLLSSCITQFVPEISEEKELLVVQGLITDQPESYSIKLSKSLPLGKESEARPVTGCMVSISDDLGNIFNLREGNAGVYLTDSTNFKGEIGRFYTLQISINNDNSILTYQSSPVQMVTVPPIDSLFYEKTVIREKDEYFPAIDGCQIYLNTYDSENKCKFYRWDYEETWVLRLLWPVENMKCWVSENSSAINIKNTSSVGETRLNRYPVNYISNYTDRLRSKYSILVKQYSMSEAEYNYWEDLKSLTVQVGGLSDIIPYSIPGNLRCIEKPDEKVLGYFSVSAKSTKRIFIDDSFNGIVDEYSNCISDTIPTDYPYDIPNYNISVWALLIHQGTIRDPPYTILTQRKGCADCTTRGTTEKPYFWIGD